MNKKEELLQKAKALSLVAHFKKSIIDHDNSASTHEKMAMANKAHAEHYEKMIEKAADDQKDHLKASMSFHKAMSGYHEKEQKANIARSEHYKAMLSAQEESADHQKVLKLLGIEESELEKTMSNPTTAVTDDAVKDAAAKDVSKDTTKDPVVAAVKDQLDLGKALDSKLEQAVGAAFERVLNSDDFNKKVDQEISKKLLERLGTSSVNTEIKTFPVARTEGNQFRNVNGNAAKSDSINTDGVDAELLDFVKME